MKHMFDLAKLYRRAVTRMPTVIDDVVPLPLPADCPYTLHELLRDV